MSGVPPERKLKFVLLCNGPQLQQWQREVLELILDEGYAAPELIVMPAKDNPSKSGWIKKILHYPWSKLLFKKYYQYFFRPGIFKTVAFGDLMVNTRIIHCAVSLKGKYSEYFSENDIRLIKSHGPDFILKFGFGILRGDILDCAPYGIWSFHHGDEQKFRGVPPAFWEIVKKERVTAAILQRLTNKLDGGLILRKGYFPTISHSWKGNLEQAIRLSVSWPADVCRQVAMLKSFPASEAGLTTLAPVYKIPDNLTFLRFLFLSLVNRIQFHFHEIFRAEQWQTGLIKMHASELLTAVNGKIDASLVTWIGARQKHRYFADGFSIEARENLLLLYEDYSYQQRKAHISASWFNAKEGSTSEAITALSEPWHLSYPYLFTHENRVYCVPESLEHGSVELYELKPATGKLEHVHCLVRGLAAADASLIYHHQRWYLFFTPAHATNTELHLWHADSLEGPFIPHILSPVKADISNARPGGRFIKIGEKLYRPAQNCTLTYGGSLIINEIKVLSETGFIEVPVATLEPPAGYSGLHTLSFAGGFLYFDVKKFVFIPSSSLFQFKKRLRLIKPAKAIQLL
jgi:hypothetical protein